MGAAWDGRIGRIGGMARFAVFAMLASSSWGCAGEADRDFDRTRRQVARALRGRDVEKLGRLSAPHVRDRIDREALVASSKSLERLASQPHVVRHEAIIFVGPDQPVRAVQTAKGWRFAEDPTPSYGQATPRQALASLVRASRSGRYDVLLSLAPKVYRAGLTEAALRVAWTEGQIAAELRRAADRLSAHLRDEILVDDHHAAMHLPDGVVVRLEREPHGWVVLDF